MALHQTDNLKLLKRSLKFISPYKFKFSLALLAIITVTALGLIQPILWGKILSKLFEKAFYEGLKFILILLALYTFRYLVSFFQDYMLSFINENIILDIKKDLYLKILNLPVKAFDDIRVGEFISRIQGDTSEIADIITRQFLSTLVDILRVISIGVIVFTISIKLSIIVLLVFPISYFVFTKFGKILREKNKLLSKELDGYYGSLNESLTGIREIKCLGVKDYKFNQFSNMVSTIKSKKIELTLLNSISIIIMNMLGLFSSIGVLSVGGYFIYKGYLTIEYYVAFSSYSSEFSSSLMNITKLNSSLQKMFNSLERIFTLMDNLNYENDTFGDIEDHEIKGTIEFKDVTFEYNKGTPALNNVSFLIENNKKTAIVGASGSGKTTIFNLINRFYKINSGEITIDGINISEFTEQTLTGKIAVVRQNPFIFNESIMDNLKLANHVATDEDIFNACKSAYIHDYISSLPNGYNTKVGENGVTLSGGQKQRLAIARALLKSTSIILFDEATSALDNESQHYIKKAINDLSKDRTIIIIAHRLSTIIDCDNILVLENSKIVGSGSHEFLIKNNNIYKRLYEAEVDNLLEKATL